MPYNPKKNGAANYKSWMQITDEQIATIQALEGIDKTDDPNSEQFAQIVHVAQSITNTNTGASELAVNLEGHECPDNTTNVTLGSNEVFLGSGWQDMKDYGVLTVSVTTDVDSATDGLEIQWSQNGIDPTDYDKFTILGGNSKTFTFGPADRYYRIKYTNGPSDQSVFSLSSIIRRTYVKPSSHRIQDSIVSEDDAELVKAVLTGERPDGSFGNVHVTQQDTLLTSLLPSRLLIPRVIPHLNVTYGADMNINGAFSGTANNIHNGTDNVYWTATSIGAGTWTFNSTDQAHTGTHSIDGTLTENGSIVNIQDGGNLSGYAAITLWIYLTAWTESKNNHLEVYFWENTGDTMVGSPVRVEDYIDENTLNSWQKATIPLVDLGITSETIDSVRFQVYSDDPAALAPDFYLDDIQLEETGGYVYEAISLPNTNFHVTSIRTIVQASVDIRLTGGMALNLDGDELFGLSALTNGIIQIMSTNDEVKFTSAIHNLNDYLQIPNSEIKNVISTGTKTTITIDTELPEPFMLGPGDFSRIIITDDLSSYLMLRVFLAGVEEVV